MTAAPQHASPHQPPAPASPGAFTEAEVSAALSDRPRWTRVGSGIERRVTAPTFLTGVALVDAIAQLAEAAQHHPDIDIRWRAVRFFLTSHDAGGLTARDFVLADQIDDVIAGRLHQ